MPPHCDTMDGPVVKAAKEALEKEDVNIILPWAPKEAENEISRAFDKTISVRKLGNQAGELADYWFFETIVRLHREGEGAPYTGIKPAGLDEGPVVPRAEKAIEHGDAKEVVEFLSRTVEDEVQKRLEHAMSLRDYNKDDVEAAREYTEAMLEFILYSHKLYVFMTSSGRHGGEGGHEH